MIVLYTFTKVGLKKKDIHWRNTVIKEENIIKIKTKSTIPLFHHHSYKYHRVIYRLITLLTLIFNILIIQYKKNVE